MHTSDIIKMPLIHVPIYVPQSDVFKSPLALIPVELAGKDAVDAVAISRARH